MKHTYTALTLLALTPTPALAVDACPGDFAPQTLPTIAGATFTTLSDAVALSPTDVWAVGWWRAPRTSSSGDDSFSLAMHFDGSSWSIAPSPQPTDAVGRNTILVMDIEAASDGTLYGVGQCVGPHHTYIAETFAMRYEGGQWSQIANMPGRYLPGAQGGGWVLEGTEVIDPDSVVFVGGGYPGTASGGHRAYAIFMDGNNFTETFAPTINNGAHRFRAAWAFGHDDILAVGGAGGGTASANGRAYIARWDGTDWNHIPLPSYGLNEVLNKVHAFSPSDIWAAGNHLAIINDQTTYVPLFLHFDGSSWTRFTSPGHCEEFVALAPDDIYAASGSTLVHWDGSSWSLVESLPVADFPSMSGLVSLGGCELLAVGSVGDATRLPYATVYAGGPAPSCDSIDFNRDGLFPDTQDVADLLSVFGGAPCPSTACNDIDFNNDGLFPDTDDISTLLHVFAGGSC